MKPVCYRMESVAERSRYAQAHLRRTAPCSFRRRQFGYHDSNRLTPDVSVQRPTPVLYRVDRRRGGISRNPRVHVGQEWEWLRPTAGQEL